MSDIFTLRLQCADKPGLVACVAGYLADRGCNIVDAQQFDDSMNNRFFMRVAFQPGDGETIETLRAGFAPIAEEAGMDWSLRDRAHAKKVVLMVLKFDHCLGDLLYRNELMRWMPPSPGIV